MMVQNQLKFPTCITTEIYCLDIVLTMMNIANITEEEAFQRVNFHWEGMDLNSEDHILFHEGLEFWAKTIYYEQSNWWNYKPEELTPKEIK
ncbi:hypothetical protein [Paenibacillus piscarius]|uniref:hypothetical protein n=1 Tax=Paenibacillus piscarius TaxID=1089681 RepID=UPI001EE97D68|nr:hypothetical protein [Paenibacillus piscarius]